MAPLVRQSLDWIREQASGSDYEVLVADNSNDHQYALPPNLVNDFPEVKLSFIDNKGFVDALNTLLPQALGEFVVIMHPDVRLNTGALNILTAFLCQHSDVGIVSPNLFYPDGRENKIRLRFPEVATEFMRVINNVSRGILKRNIVSDEILWDRSGDANTETVMSVFMMIRKEVLDKVASVDSRIWTYYANDYLCGAARRLGWQCYYVKDAIAVHYERYTDPKLYSSAEESSYKRSSTPVNSRMERDRLLFLSSIASPARLLLFRIVACVEYLLLLLFDLRHPRDRKTHIQQLFATLAVVCGLHDS